MRAVITPYDDVVPTAVRLHQPSRLLEIAFDERRALSVCRANTCACSRRGGVRGLVAATSWSAKVDVNIADTTLLASYVIQLHFDD